MLTAPAQASGGTLNAWDEIVTEQGAPPFWVAVGSSSGSWAGIYTVKPKIGAIATSGLYETVPTDTGALDAISCDWNPAGNDGNGSDSCMLVGMGSGDSGDVVNVTFWLKGGVSGYGPPWGTPWYSPPQLLDRTRRPDPYAAFGRRAQCLGDWHRHGERLAQKHEELESLEARYDAQAYGRAYCRRDRYNQDRCQDIHIPGPYRDCRDDELRKDLERGMVSSEP
jgi:hypothetical protein